MVKRSCEINLVNFSPEKLFVILCLNRPNNTSKCERELKTQKNYSGAKLNFKIFAIYILKLEKIYKNNSAIKL
jgi:hypothetical protein